VLRVSMPQLRTICILVVSGRTRKAGFSARSYSSATSSARGPLCKCSSAWGPRAAVPESVNELLYRISGPWGSYDGLARRAPHDASTPFP
jgi:hypothetical protein